MLNMKTEIKKEVKIEIKEPVAEVFVNPTFIGEERVESSWRILSNIDGVLDAIHRTSGKAFYGTIAEFQSKLKG
jgi:hypothetical protein